MQHQAENCREAPFLSAKRQPLTVIAGLLRRCYSQRRTGSKRRTRYILRTGELLPKFESFKFYVVDPSKGIKRLRSKRRRESRVKQQLKGKVLSYGVLLYDEAAAAILRIPVFCHGHKYILAGHLCRNGNPFYL